MNGRSFVVAGLAASLVAVLFVPGEAVAFNRYNDGCQNCHGSFSANPYTSAKGGTWPASAHTVHRSNSYMAAACNLCHTSTDSNNPFIGSSDGTSNTTGWGCVGCHGNLYSGQASGVGLRKHHGAKGMTQCTTGCHAGDPTPVAESIKPPYYGLADSKVASSCNNDTGTTEDWAGTSTGLDNDGDGFYDTADTDCGGNPCGNGKVDPGETCDPPSSCPTSCNDGNACTTDVLSGSAATCTSKCTYTSITSCVNGDACCPTGCNANNDNNCSPTCGNSVIESGETCDPQSSCPTTCNDGNACTTDVMTGASATCNAACSHQNITTCASGDGCCPPGCNSLNDNDCSVTCGNSVVEAGETCDPPSSCPATCDDGNACSIDLKTGNSATCNVACSHNLISTCVSNDGCCPAGCNANTDNDCSVACGNGVIESGETCDPPTSCPTTCDDGNVCTIDSKTGNSATCNVACSHNAITTCQSGDGCCPAGCNANSDADCSASCGNGLVEAGETCDPPSSCPATCNDGNTCTIDTQTGSAASCNLVCNHASITTCVGGDGCCPAGCKSNKDSDCSASCGNGVVEQGETCDPPSSCPTSCSDGNSCTLDTLTGSAANCNVVCAHSSITTCANGDGCCPTGCNANIDDSCSPSCGNSTIEAGETCDPPSSCPSTCDDNVACTIDTTTGSAANCNLACGHSTISACANGDGCCPAGCNSLNDGDCSPSCGNTVIESGETCDPPSSCPASCDDNVACTVDSSSGSAANCNLACSHTAIVSCANNDGCCPAGCNANDDLDCIAVCGNGVVEAGESCDPQSSCPTTCDDSNACTFDALTGSATQCNVGCTNTAITLCGGADGCCPAGCNSSNDGDCSATCGNGVIDTGETCDPQSSCPSSCDDSNACTADTTTGSAANCNVECSHTQVTICSSGDGCCPSACDSLSDSDCQVACGNGVIEAGETCDPPGNCPASCDDTNACTVDTMTGTAESCTAACSNTVITACANGDSCCPAGCDSSNDNDCSPTCGNGNVDTGETCDPPGTCPTTCDDNNACTKDTKTGSAENCNVACAHSAVTACLSADGCCPSGCTSTTDSDCKVPDGGLPDSGPDTGTKTDAGPDGGTKTDGGTTTDGGTKTDGGLETEGGTEEPGSSDEGGCGCSTPGHSSTPWSLSIAAWIAALAAVRFARRR